MTRAQRNEQDLNDAIDYLAGLTAARRLTAGTSTPALRRARRRGDRALERFLTRHRGLIVARARALGANADEVDDLVAVGMHAMSIALADWRPGAGLSPRNWSTFYLDHRLREELRVLRRGIVGAPPGAVVPLSSVPEGSSYANDPARIVGSQACVDVLVSFQANLGCDCARTPSVDRPYCCWRMLRALRSSTHHRLVQSLVSE